MRFAAYRMPVAGMKSRAAIKQAELLDYVIELEDHIKDYPVIVTHCDCIELAEQLFNCNLKDYKTAPFRIITYSFISFK